MHLCEIEALAVGQDGSRPGAIAEGQFPGVVAGSTLPATTCLSPQRQSCSASGARSCMVTSTSTGATTLPLARDRGHRALNPRE